MKDITEIKFYIAKNFQKYDYYGNRPKLLLSRTNKLSTGHSMTKNTPGISNKQIFQKLVKLK